MKTEDIATKSDLLIIKQELLEAIYDKNKKQMLDEEWMTEKEIRERFKVKSPTTIRKYLKAKKFGGKNLYPLSDVLRLLNNTGQ